MLTSLEAICEAAFVFMDN